MSAEDLGGATLHCTTSGVTDHFAQVGRHLRSKETRVGHHTLYVGHVGHDHAWQLNAAAVEGRDCHAVLQYAVSDDVVIQVYAIIKV